MAAAAGDEQHAGAPAEEAPKKGHARGRVECSGDGRKACCTAARALAAGRAWGRVVVASHSVAVGERAHVASTDG